MVMIDQSPLAHDDEHRERDKERERRKNKKGRELGEWVKSLRRSYIGWWWLTKSHITPLISSDEDVDDEFMRFHKLCFGEGVCFLLVIDIEREMKKRKEKKNGERAFGKAQALLALETLWVLWTWWWSSPFSCDKQRNKEMVFVFFLHWK